MSDNDDDDSDGWCTEELVIPSPALPKDTEGKKDDDDNEDYWKVETKSKDPDPDPDPAILVKKKDQGNNNSSSSSLAKDDGDSGGEPMILLDMTLLNPEIHSKFDKNSVIDPTAASLLRRNIESNYEQYAKDATLVGNGTVIPCGSSVWRPALMRLREERSGHYFCPIFPPKQKK